MKKFFIVVGLVMFGTILPTASAEQIFRIEIGKKGKKYSQSELEDRIWELERAVWQLQARIYNLESEKNDRGEKRKEGWSCTIETMGNIYSATGSTQAEAKSRTINKCKKERGGDGFFCDSPECEGE